MLGAKVAVDDVLGKRNVVTGNGLVEATESDLANDVAEAPLVQPVEVCGLAAGSAGLVGGAEGAGDVAFVAPGVGADDPVVVGVLDTQTLGKRPRGENDDLDPETRQPVWR